MKMRRWFAFLVFAGLTIPGTFAQRSSRKFVDLTHPFSRDTVYWPTAEGFRLKVEAAGVTEKGFYYAANSFCAAEHGGTHIDAPIHFAEGMPYVDQIALDRLVAPGVVVDVSERAAADPDYQISVEDLTEWERKHSRLNRGVILLFRTGWDKFYPDRKSYLGTEERGEAAVGDLRFPGLDPEAARWLVSNRGIASVGIDTASIDRGRSTLFESHQILFKAGIPAFENLARLGELPPRGFLLLALPMKIQGGSGAPLRVVAVLDQ